MDGGVADTATCSYTGRLPERKGVSEAFKIALAGPAQMLHRVGWGRARGNTSRTTQAVGKRCYFRSGSPVPTT